MEVKRIIFFLFIVSFSSGVLSQNYRISNCSDTTFNGLYLVSHGERVQYLSSSKAMYALQKKTDGWVITEREGRSLAVPYLFNADTLSLEFPPSSGWKLIVDERMLSQSDLKVIRINKQHFPVWMFPLLLFVAFLWITIGGKHWRTSKRRAI